jgi:hypothetical protein
MEQIVPDLLIKAVRRRSAQLHHEIDLITQQMGAGQGTQFSSLSFRKDIDTLLSFLYDTYLLDIQSNYVRPCPFRHGIHIHLAALARVQVDQNVDELKARQCSLSDVTGLPFDYRDLPADDLLSNLPHYFPYDLVFQDLIWRGVFMEKLIGIVFTYDPAQHKSAIREIFALLRGKHNDQFVLLVVAEALLSFFVSGEIHQSV